MLTLPYLVQNVRITTPGKLSSRAAFRHHSQIRSMNTTSVAPSVQVWRCTVFNSAGRSSQNPHGLDSVAGWRSMTSFLDTCMTVPF